MSERFKGIHRTFTTAKERINSARTTVNQRVDQVMETLSPYAVRSMGLMSQALANADIRNIAADMTGTAAAHYPKLGTVISTTYQELTSPVVPDGHAPGILSIAARHLREHAPAQDTRYGIHSSERLLAGLENDHLSLLSRALLGLSAFWDDDTMTHARDFGHRTMDAMNSVYARSTTPAPTAA